jgi:hypothetical protein
LPDSKDVKETANKVGKEAEKKGKQIEKKGKQYADKAKVRYRLVSARLCLFESAEDTDIQQKELHEAESQLAPYWEKTKDIVLRPGTLGGLMGIGESRYVSSRGMRTVRLIDQPTSVY